MKRVFLVFLIFSLSLWAESPLKKLSLQLNWDYQFEFAGFIAAKEKGFYKKAGFDVRLLKFDSNKNLYEGLKKGEYDFLVENSRFFLVPNVQKQFILLSNYFKQSPFALITQKDILSLSALKNKRVMISDSSLNSDSIALMLDRFDMDKEDFVQAEQTHNIQDFIDKKVDATTLFTSNELFDVIESGINYNIFSPTNYGINAPDVNLITTQKTYNNEKELVRAFIQASNEGWEYALNHPDEIITLILEKYSQAKSRKALEFEALRVKESVMEDVYAIGSIPLELFSSYFEYLKKYKNIDVDADTFLHFTKKVQLTQKEKRWLSKHPTVTVDLGDVQEPFYFYDKKTQRFQGYAIDYLKELESQLGIEFEFFVSKEPPKDGLKLIDTPSVSILRKGVSYIKTSSDLKNRKVVVDSSLVYKALKRSYPSMSIFLQPDFNTALNALQKKEAEIFLTNMVSTKYWFKQQKNSDFQVIANGKHNIPIFVSFNEKLGRYGKSLLMKGLKNISDNTKMYLESKWTLSDQKEPFDYTLVYEVFVAVLLVILIIIIWNLNLKRAVKQKTQRINALLKNTEQKVHERTQDLNRVKEDLENLLTQTMDSIKYASLIQHGVIPKKSLLEERLDEALVLWQPKDIVGGDIYLFDTLRDKDELMLMVIDCTGHGVHGALVTMLVKAIERQVIAQIKNSQGEVYPSEVLKEFHNIMSNLMDKNEMEKPFDAGFDGGVVYYNKQTGVLRYSGAKTPLFYIDNGKLVVFKSNRCSIGYNRSKREVKLEDKEIYVTNSMQFYLTTDGYLDQNGGEKGFPFGKQRFMNLIQDNWHKPLWQQKEIFIKALNEYRKNEPVNDDMAMVAFKINKEQK